MIWYVQKVVHIISSLLASELLTIVTVAFVFSSFRLPAPPPLAGSMIEINFITTCQAPLVREQSQPRTELHPAGEKVVNEAMFLMLHFLCDSLKVKGHDVALSQVFPQVENSR